jgi:DNA recombination protein RmuC
MIIYIALFFVGVLLGLGIMYLVSKAWNAVLQTEKTQQGKIIEDLNKKIIETQTISNDQIQTINAKEIKIAELNVTMATTMDSIEQHKKDVQGIQEQMKLYFQNTSNDLLTKQTGAFGEQSAKAINALLEPFKCEMKIINDSIQQETRSKGTLEGAIKQIVESNTKINIQADNLVKALKGDNKVQGNWGEITLEKILEESELRKNKDYIYQAENMSLKDEDNRTVRPDFIVNLPENKHIIIDSKVSLTDYERYVSEQNDKNKEAHLKSFLSSVKRHVNQLSEKTYHDIDKLNTPDFVLMFLCIEAAYILAIQKDSNLHSYAWDKKIIIVCPSTLYATLRTINAVWRLELQNQNALEIAKKGGELYDKLVAFVEDLTKVGSQLETVKKTYDLSMNKLRTGTGNLVTRAEGLKKLGIKCNKKLPVELIDQDDDAEEASP